jgi:hypothetical protein
MGFARRATLHYRRLLRLTVFAAFVSLVIYAMAPAPAQFWPSTWIGRFGARLRSRVVWRALTNPVGSLIDEGGRAMNAKIIFCSSLALAAGAMSIAPVSASVTLLLAAGGGGGSGLVSAGGGGQVTPSGDGLGGAGGSGNAEGCFAPCYNGGGGAGWLGPGGPGEGTGSGGGGQSFPSFAGGGGGGGFGGGGGGANIAGGGGGGYSGGDGGDAFLGGAGAHRTSIRHSRPS